MKKLIVLVSVLAMAGVASANLLTNPSFELGTGQGGSVDSAAITGWTFWGGGWWANDTAEDGTWSIKRWDNGTGMFQDFTATPSQTYDFSVWGNDGALEPLVDRTMDLRVEWFDAGNGSLANVLLGQLTPGGALDTWRQVSGSAVAPANTAYGRFLIVTEGGGSAGGSLFFDSADVDVQAIPEPAALTLLGIGFLGLSHLRRKLRK